MSDLLARATAELHESSVAEVSLPENRDGLRDAARRKPQQYPWVFARCGTFTTGEPRLFLQPERQLLWRADRPMRRATLMVGPFDSNTHR